MGKISLRSLCYAVLPLVAFPIFMWAIAQIGQLLSAKNDLVVYGGFLLLIALIVAAVFGFMRWLMFMHSATTKNTDEPTPAK